MVSAARKRIEEAQDDEGTAQMLLEIHKHIAQETVSMNPAFDDKGLDEEVAQALLYLPADLDPFRQISSTRTGYRESLERSSCLRTLKRSRAMPNLHMKYPPARVAILLMLSRNR